MASAERGARRQPRPVRRSTDRPTARVAARVVLLAVLLTGCTSVLVGVVGIHVVAAQPGPGPVDPAVVRDDVRDVMSRPAFDYSPSIADRVSEWIGDQLRKLFGPGEGAAGGGTFGGGIGALFGWLLIVGAVVAIVAVVLWVVLNRTRSPEVEPDPVDEAVVEHRRSAGEWRSDAERLEAAGDWKGAMRARFRHLVRVLVDRRQLPDVPGRTTGELRVDLAVTTPGAVDAFETCCILFELAWYAGAPTGADEVARIRAESDRVLAAAVSERFDGVLLADGGGAVDGEDGLLATGDRV